ncbi:MAG: glycosyltransferase [Candidatus Saccharimonadales bacterium]
MKAKSTPLISVVMSVYNGEDFLKAAIESILNQTFRDFEFIIINDGSTDSSKKIIDSYKDPRIVSINQKNIGLIASLNKGISKAKGKYIARMDADDISLPNRFEKEVEWLNQDNSRGLVSTFFELIDFKTSEPIGTTLVFPIQNDDLRRAFYFTNPFAHGAAMYRKDAIATVGEYTTKYGPTEDYELWRRISKKYEVGLMPDVLYQYRINNPNSESQSKNDVQQKFIAKIQEECWREPFVRKSAYEVTHGYRTITTDIYGKYTESVKDVYVSHQFTLAKFSLLRGRTRQGIEIIQGLVPIKPKHAILLLQYLPTSLKLSIRRII